MPLDPDHLLAAMPIETRQDFTRRDTILYALGVGVGHDRPTDANTLRFLHEAQLLALPTMASVLASPGFWQREPRYGIDGSRLLHAEQSIRFHRSLPVEGTVTGSTDIVSIYDKGAQKNALIYVRRQIRDGRSGELLATALQGLLLRGQGGFGGVSASPKPRPVPTELPDLTIDAETRPDQALLYRLSGDDNPLHVDEKVAAAAGFERPILHGLCTYGIVGRVLLSALCDSQPERLTRLDARFTSPVYPGETIRTEIWCEPGQAAFRARAVERDTIVLDFGLVEHS